MLRFILASLLAVAVAAETAAADPDPAGAAATAPQVNSAARQSTIDLVNRANALYNKG
jgi:hypothetical protein